MKTLLVIFAIASICFALPLESEDDATNAPVNGNDGSTPAPDEPTGSPAPPQFNQTFPNGTVKAGAPVQSSIPVHIAQGVELTISTDKLAALYVSLDPKVPKPSADNYAYAVFTTATNNFTATIQIPSDKLKASGAWEYEFSDLADAPTDTNIFTMIQAISAEVKYVYSYKPIDTTPASVSVTAPTTTTTTTSSSTMLAPALFNTFLLIFLYNYFTFSK